MFSSHFSLQGNDYLVQPGDYSRLARELPSVVRMHTVDYEDWNHIDFLTGVDAPRLVLILRVLFVNLKLFRILYPFIIETMNKYRSLGQG